MRIGAQTIQSKKTHEYFWKKVLMKGNHTSVAPSKRYKISIMTMPRKWRINIKNPSPLNWWSAIRFRRRLCPCELLRTLYIWPFRSYVSSSQRTACVDQTSHCEQTTDPLVPTDAHGIWLRQISRSDCTLVTYNCQRVSTNWVDSGCRNSGVTFQLCRKWIWTNVMQSWIRRHEIA